MAEDPHQGKWLKDFRRRFTSFDSLMLIIGGALGFAGNALFSGNVPATVVMTVVAVLTIMAALSIDRFRHGAQVTLQRSHDHFTTQLDQHHLQLQGRLSKHLTYVHASVDFVNDPESNSGKDAGYDAAKAAVERAKHRILVIGDYSPPPTVGADLDRVPPRNRAAYLGAIERMLEERLKADDPALPILHYRRYIQRPLGIYEEVRGRETARPGIVLTDKDMVGDLQAFDHCARVLQIKASADRAQSNRISVDVRLIPFLPNCPSVLLVDDREVQFTIPTRHDEPGDKYAELGLLGVLVMEDHANGEQICAPFVRLFDRLVKFSVFVRKIEGAEVPSVEVEPSDVDRAIRLPGTAETPSAS